jgi:uncharacterized glyoxalase superfamily protein PhnB
MQYRKLTPNLIVRDVEASIAFYRDVLGFQPGMTVPEQPPYVFGSVNFGEVEIFFNQQQAAVEEYRLFADKPVGGTLTLFLEIEGIDELLTKVEKHGAKIVMPLEKKFYGTREFALLDPDGWVITFSEREK